MLLRLNIRNIALIDEANIELGEGFNVVTGETGAGKSIIIDSINAILGERISKAIIRTGRDKALVEAVFIVDNGRFTDVYEQTGIEPEEDGTLIISREFTTSGKNTCRINGKMATVSMVKAFGERLVDMHGQHDNQSLLRTESHMELLDSFGGESVQKLKSVYSSHLKTYKELLERLRSLSGGPGERERKMDILSFQIDEIKKAKLKMDEDKELNKQRVLLSNSEKISNALSAAYDLLYSGERTGKSAADSMNEALYHLQSVSAFGQQYQDLADELSSLIYRLEDVIGNIRRENEVGLFDPGALEKIEERLDLIFSLKRKYGKTIEDILEFCAGCERELENLQRSGELEEELKSRLKQTATELLIVAAQLSSERQKAAEVLGKNITSQLEDLEMKKAKFKADVQYIDRADGAPGEEFGSGFEPAGRKLTFPQNGLDKIEFLISPNVGEPLKPLSKIASGGELSRIMLAIKTILAEVDKIPTLIFDEIDIGISGKAASKVGEKLSYISENHQVICVTHLPQIACLADNHFLIEKSMDDESTVTVVKKLEGDEITSEIGRMLGGVEKTNASLEYAKELINNAARLKSRQ